MIGDKPVVSFRVLVKKDGGPWRVVKCSTDLGDAIREAMKLRTTSQQPEVQRG